MATCSLAVTVHDPGADFLPGLRRLASPLRETFPAGAAVITSRTSPEIASFAAQVLGWTTVVVEPDGQVGLHRRLAVEHALAATPHPEAVGYSDVDHMLRWLEAAPAEVKAVAERGDDFVVVGRSEAAMIRSPARLRETERLVNHIYELITAERCDLMFAIRRMTRAVAESILANCTEDSLANDVEWPMFARRTGCPVTYFESDALDYRAREDFDAAGDTRDSDPAQWIARVEMANRQVQVFKQFLESPTDA